jgi:hypothetical protein
MYMYDCMYEMCVCVCVCGLSSGQSAWGHSKFPTCLCQYNTMYVYSIYWENAIVSDADGRAIIRKVTRSYFQHVSGIITLVNPVTVNPEVG